MALSSNNDRFDFDDDDDDFPSRRAPRRRNPFDDFGRGSTQGYSQKRQSRSRYDDDDDHFSQNTSFKFDMPKERSGGRSRNFDDEYDFDALFAEQEDRRPSSRLGGMMGGGFEERQGYGGDSFSNSEFDKIVWENETLETFVKDFYKERELEHVKNRSPEE